MSTKERKNTPALDRRHFLKSSAGVALAGLGSTMMSSELQAKNNWKNHKKQNSDEHFWNKVQKEFTLDKKTTYMNVGTTGSMPKSVLQDYNANNQIVAQNPWDMHQNVWDIKI